jgi:hypothetical protein
MALKSPAEVERIYHEFLQLVPTFEACLSEMPDAALRVCSIIAHTRTIEICRARGEILSEADQDHALKVLKGLLKRSKVSKLSDDFRYIFRVVVEIAMRSYLGTQFLYWEKSGSNPRGPSGII